MKYLFLALFCSLLIFATSNSFAFNVPTPTGFATDTSGKLSSTQVSQLNQRLTDYNHRTQNEIAVVVVSSLQGESVEDVANQIFKSYKIGKAGLDNGVLLFIATGDRKTRIETGKGIGGELTDIQTHAILSAMRPSLGKGDFYGGVSLGLDQIQAKLDTRKDQKAEPGSGQQFNQPVQQENNDTKSNVQSKGGCSMSGDIGNTVGFSFGLLAAFVAVVFLVRRYIYNREVRKMRELEEKVDAEMAASNFLEQSSPGFINEQPIQAVELKSTTNVVPNRTQVVPLSPTVYEKPAAEILFSNLESQRKEQEQARRRAEEERRATRRRKESSSESSYAPSYSVPDSTPDFGGGFGGGDSGGGGSSSDF